MSKKKITMKPARPLGSASPMDVDLLERMVKLMTANDLNTVDVRDGEKRVILKRGPAIVPSPIHYAAPIHHQNTPNPIPTGLAALGFGELNRGAASDPTTNDDSDLHPIKSPMVGTFYSAASPDAKPFVQVGTTVDEDTDICIIEAMKVFNNIKAETRGTVAKILVTNGQTVEFGQTLFLVKP